MLVITVCAPVVKRSHSVFRCMSTVSARQVGLRSKGALESAGGLLKKHGFLGPTSDQLTVHLWGQSPGGGFFKASQATDSIR